MGKGYHRTLRLWLFQLTGEGLTGRDGGPGVGPFWRAASTDAAKTSSQSAARGSRQRPSPQTAGEGPLPGGGRPPQHHSTTTRAICRLVS